MSDEETEKILCKYGEKCYQKNKEHLDKYRHPTKRVRSPIKDSNKRARVSRSPIEEDENKSEDAVESKNESGDAVESKNENETGFESTKELIKKYFLVDMPEDFYDFYTFCQNYSKDKPRDALKAVDLVLVGPYDVLMGSGSEVEGDHLLHWRYYYDPAEFQTVIKGDDKTEYHMGYYRDSPDEKPVFVAENHAKNDCIIKPIGENIFAAINTYIEAYLAKANPFKKMEISKLQKALKNKAEELKYDLSKRSSSMAKRQRLVVCKTFNTVGIVVPYNKKTTIGYRELIVSDKELVKICDRIAKSSDDNRKTAMSELNPVVTAATIAVDECDFGTGLELGIDLFCYGNEHLDATALRLLSSAYSVLNRDDFITIAETHLKNRKKGLPHIVDYS